MAMNERKILEFLGTHDQFDYTITEIKKCLGYKHTATVLNTVVRLSKQSKVMRVRSVSENAWTWQLPEWITDERYDELNRRW